MMMTSDRINKLLEFLKSSPDDSFLNHALALELIKENKDDEAEKYFRNNLDRSPEYVATYYHLGKLLERSGRIEEAISTYERGMAVARAAGDSHSYNELNGVYEDLIY